MAKEAYFTDEKFYVYMRRQGSIMTNTILQKKGFSVQRIIILKLILTSCSNLTFHEKSRLLTNFISLARKDCPKSEIFKLSQLIINMLKEIPGLELTLQQINLINKILQEGCSNRFNTFK